MPQVRTATTTTMPRNQSYVDQIYGLAQGLYGRGGIAPYQGLQIAPMSQQRADALSLTEQRAREGTPFLKPMTQQLTSTFRGDFLSPESNPYLRSTFDQAAQAVGENFRDFTVPQTDSQFALAGRYGSGLYNNAQQRNQEVLGRTLNELATNIYAPAYENERQRQLSAMRYAPNAQNMGYFDTGRLAAVGQERENQMQRQLNLDEQRFLQAQERPFDALNRYANVIGALGSRAGTVTGTQSIPDNNLTTADYIGLGLSGLMGLNQLGSQGQTLRGILGSGFGNIRDFLTG